MNHHQVGSHHYGSGRGRGRGRGSSYYRQQQQQQQQQQHQYEYDMMTSMGSAVGAASAVVGGYPYTTSHNDYLPNTGHYQHPPPQSILHPQQQNTDPMIQNPHPQQQYTTPEMMMMYGGHPYPAAEDSNEHYYATNHHQNTSSPYEPHGYNPQQSQQPAVAHYGGGAWDDPVVPVLHPTDPHFHHHLHHHHHDGSDYGMSQQQHQHHPQMILADAAAASVPPGSYYPLPPMQPETLFGYPITALAYDDVYSALYIATATKAMSSSSSSSLDVLHHKRKHTTTSRAAMMATHDPMTGMVYSSVASHPEAEPPILQAIYNSLYGIMATDNNNNNNNNTTHHHHHHRMIPNHAYKPPYGETDPALAVTTTTTTTTTSSTSPSTSTGPKSHHHHHVGVVDSSSTSTTAAATTTKPAFQMGVTTLLPVTGQGNVASVSPSGIRIHSHGGLQLADLHMEGMMCGTIHPIGSGSSGGSSTCQQQQQQDAYLTHLTVGGIASAPAALAVATAKKYHLHCLDVYQGLQTVASYSFLDRQNKSSHDTTTTATMTATDIAVTSLATSHSRGCVLAGCSDGCLRMMDGRMKNLVATMKSHKGGVVNMAVSDDGTLVATTGNGSTVSSRRRTSSLYSFPDPTVLVNDIRYLGRGGFPHPFSGLRGGPRFLAFIPNVVVVGDDNHHHHHSSMTTSNRLLVASGQVGGGLQIVTPFQEDTTTTSASNFILPQLGRGESISSMCVSEDNLALGTSQGKVLQYKLAGYEPHSPTILSSNNSNIVAMNHPTGVFVPSSSSHHGTTPSGSSSVVSTLSRGGSSSRNSISEKRPLKMPPFHPSLPPLSLEPTLLQQQQQPPSSSSAAADNTNACVRMGANEKIKSLFTAYILTAEPNISAIGDPTDRSTTSFGPIATNPLVPQTGLRVSPDLVKKVNHKVDFLQTIPTSSLNLDLFQDHRLEEAKERDRRRTKADPLPNPNKMIYSSKLFGLCYRESLNRGKRLGKRNRKDERTSSSSSSTAMTTTGSNSSDDLVLQIPIRYKIRLRPAHLSASSFSHCDFNETGLIPGWDYPMTMPNAFVSPVLLLLFFMSELRTPILSTQLARPASRERSLTSELGYLFHRIETISKLAMLFPTKTRAGAMTRLDAWAPSSFISILSTMPEAEQLQILDGSPAAVASPRRPEAFYRFLLYQLNKELNRENSSPTDLIQTLCGVDFVSVNQFVSGTGQQSKTTTKQLTIELSYKKFLNEEATVTNVSFGEVLQSSLCRAVELGAWNQTSKSYDTIVQRKIATSLPTILSLSADCAGLKEEEGLSLWRSNGTDHGHWLPEQIEIELEDDGSVIVRELVLGDDDSEEWKETKGKEAIPDSISKVVKEISSSNGPKKRRYRLDAAVSMVRDDLDRNCPEEIRWGCGPEEGPFGHHVLHVRIPTELKKDLICKQREVVEEYLSSELPADIESMTLLGRDVDKKVLRKRCDYAEERMVSLAEKGNGSSDWIVINGFVVTDTVVEDARAFHVEFKEPSLIIFRAMDEDLPDGESGPETRDNVDNKNFANFSVPPEVLRTASLTNGSRSPFVMNQKSSALPGAGELVAFDAEFISVQEEESALTLSGSKVTIRETRHALARISVIHGKNRAVIVDDHIQPNEPVSDYLTRFSGIVPEDLSPKHSRHHLISSRAAYLKLRYLVERGCIFVGHGLQQDFWTANLAVPASQIIDTVDIYHKPAQRYISLRFLTNFVLNRDMQQDVHDSVEDAVAALELYNKALELKKEGKFDQVLNDLYEYGRKTDWKLGVDGGGK